MNVVDGLNVTGPTKLIDATSSKQLTISTSSLTANQTLTAPNATGTICISDIDNNVSTGQTITSSAASNPGLTIKGLSGQTADFINCITYGGTYVAWIDPSGNISCQVVAATGVNLNGSLNLSSTSGIVSPGVWSMTSAGALTVQSIDCITPIPATSGGTGTSGTNLPHAWCYFTVSGTTPTVQQSYNVNSITRNTVGEYTVVFSTNTTSSYPCVVATADQPSSGYLTCQIVTHTNHSVTLLTSVGTTLTDPTGLNVIVYGT